MYVCDSSLFSSVEYKNINFGFWQLWQEYQDYLYRCCVKWMGNDIDAEDVLSQAMLKAWDKVRNSTVEIKNFKPWVAKLTYNLCVDIHRERSRGGKQVESLDIIGFEHQEEIASQEENPLIAATQQELANFFCLAIDELPPRLRETFILHFQEELSYKEIAEKLNISYENVRKRISQSRKILQQRYDQDFLGEDQSKSGFVSQCELRNNSEKINQIEVNHIEVAKSEDLELSNLELSEQETLLNQINIVADEQSNIKGKEVDKNSPNLNVNVLPLLKVLDNWKIGKTRLSNLGKWLNFEVMQNLHLKRINSIWQMLADSGGRISSTFSFIISIN
jgi:RNA polymerase sigma-70 factor (ECF subfamily)